MIKLSGILSLTLAVAVLFPSCDSNEQEVAQLKQEKQAFEYKLQAWQDYYARIKCLSDPLHAMEALDITIELGTTLENYHRRILAAHNMLEEAGCKAELKAPLEQIMAYHALASRIWAARNQGRAGALAAEFIIQVNPLWQKFNYPLPRSMALGLQKGLEEYATASGPAQQQTLNQVTSLLNNPETMIELASAANQLLWHQAHNELEEFRDKLMSEPEVIRLPDGLAK